MNTVGYIIFHREILARPWAKKDSEAVHVFLHLLCEAAFEARPELFAGKPITLGPGQLITGRDKIARETGVHPSKVQRVLIKLEKIGEIEQQTANTARLITVTSATTRTPNEQRPAEPAPHESTVHSPQTAAQPGTETFDLLKRIGKPAAQMWTHGGIQKTFQTPDHADLAIEWMAYCCDRGKPYASHSEIIRMVETFNKHTLEDLRLIIGYSYDHKYPVLYPDRLPRLKTQNPKPKTANTHKPEVIQKDRFTTERQKAQPSGLVKY